MSVKTIKIQLLAVPSVTLAGAYNAYAVNSVASFTKAQQAEWLATQIHNGILTMHQVTAYAGSHIAPTWTPPPVVPAAPVVSGSPLSDALGRHEQEIKKIQGGYVTLESMIKGTQASIHGIANNVAGLPSASAVASIGVVAARAEAEAIKHGDAIHGVAVEVAKLSKAVKSIKPQDIDAEAAVNAAVAGAFKQFKESLTPAETAAAAAQVDGLMVGRKTAQDVFGIDVRDVKGNHVMVDLYSHPSAPQVDPDFIWTEEVLTMMLMAQDADPKALPCNVWCGGERGTGKSETARQWAAMTGRNYVRFNVQKHTSVEEIAGAIGLVNGNTQFVMSDLLQAFTTPSSVILIDEPTNGDQAVLSFFNGLLEVNSAVSIGGAVRRRAAGVMVFAADNTLGAGDSTGNYLGLKTMNAALLDRFPFKPEFTYLDPYVESAAIQKRTGCNDVLANHVVAAWSAMRGKVSSGDIICAPSIRGAMAFIAACKRLKPVAAWQMTVVNGSAEESVPALQSIFSACIDSSLIQDNI